jgi:hypothetical protein
MVYPVVVQVVQWAMAVDIHLRSRMALAVGVIPIRTNTDIGIEIMVTCHRVVVVVELVVGEDAATRAIVNSLVDVDLVVEDFIIKTV